MAKNKPPLVRLHELAPGQAGDFFVVLADKTRGARRDGKPFYTCRFKDARRQVTVMAWSDSPWFGACEKDWQVGQFFKVRAAYEEHPTYGPQLDVQNIRPVTDSDQADGFDPFDFVEHSRYNADSMFQELWGLAETQIGNVPLRRLVLNLLQRHGRELKRRPGSPRHYYPFAGGLLEHILSVTHTCLHLVDKYAAVYADLQPPLNRDLVIAGAMLHDLGRVVELGDDILTTESTVPGRLMGHVLLGRDLVHGMAQELGDVDPELVQLLEHMILSHLTLPEWGSPRLPMIPECLILHHADDLDAKLEMYVRCLSRDQETGPFTARDPVLGKPLLKGRKV